VGRGVRSGEGRGEYASLALGGWTPLVHVVGGLRICGEKDLWKRWVLSLN